MLYKKLMMFIISLIATASMHAYYSPPKGPTNETFKQAKCRFSRMKVREVRNVNMCALTHNQITAFKDLASSIFRREIASAGCFSQANRRKYEVMYQKIGEYDLCQQKAL